MITCAELIPYAPRWYNSRPSFMTYAIAWVSWHLSLANVQWEQLCTMTVLARPSSTYYAATYWLHKYHSFAIDFTELHSSEHSSRLIAEQSGPRNPLQNIHASFPFVCFFFSARLLLYKILLNKILFKLVEGFYISLLFGNSNSMQMRNDDSLWFWISLEKQICPPWRSSSFN